MNDLAESIATHITTSSQKLRKEKLNTGYLLVMIRGNRFTETPYYAKYGQKLPYPTNDASTLIAFAKDFLKKIFKEGVSYSKSGISFLELTPEDIFQYSLFNEHGDETKIKKAAELNNSLDTINYKWGKLTIFPAECGVKDNQNKYYITGQKSDPSSWQARADKRSPNYTTEWQEIPTVY